MRNDLCRDKQPQGCRVAQHPYRLLFCARAMPEPIPLKQPDPFETFWREYPPCFRKSGKSLARKLFEAITSEKGLSTRNLIRDSGLFVQAFHQASPEDILQGLRRWKANLPQDYNDQYIPAPSNWLNRAGWED